VSPRCKVACEALFTALLSGVTGLLGYIADSCALRADECAALPGSTYCAAILTCMAKSELPSMSCTEINEALGNPDGGTAK